MDFEFFLAQRKDNDKWDVLDTEQRIIEQFDTQEQAVAFIDEQMGNSNWQYATIKDETDGSAQVMLDQRKATLQ